MRFILLICILLSSNFVSSNFVSSNFVSSNFVNSNEALGLDSCTAIDLRNHLKVNTCDKTTFNKIINCISKQSTHIDSKSTLIDLLIQHCDPSLFFQDKVISLISNPSLEWYIKEQIIIQYQQNSNECSSEITESLLKYVFNSNKVLYGVGDFKARNMIWHLANTRSPCDKDIISTFSSFLQNNDISIEMSDFREEITNPIMWALVRLGLKNQNNFVATTLKEIVMSDNVSQYIQSRAIKALKDLAPYLPSAVQALADIVANLKTTNNSNSVFINEGKLETRWRHNKKLQLYALISLEQLFLMDNFLKDNLSFFEETELNMVEAIYHLCDIYQNNNPLYGECHKDILNFLLPIIDQDKKDPNHSFLNTHQRYRYKAFLNIELYDINKAKLRESIELIFNRSSIQSILRHL